MAEAASAQLSIGEFPWPIRNEMPRRERGG